MTAEDRLIQALTVWAALDAQLPGTVKPPLVRSRKLDIDRVYTDARYHAVRGRVFGWDCRCDGCGGDD